MPSSSIDPAVWIGAIAALVTAVLVPVQGMVKAWLEYKTGHRAGEALANDAAKAIPSGSLQPYFSDPALLDALHDIAAAIREDTSAEDKRDKDRLAIAIEDFNEHFGSGRHEVGRRR